MKKNQQNKDEMVVLLINENDSDKIKMSIVRCFPDRDVSFSEPLTRGYLKFDQMIDYEDVAGKIAKTDFTHILISGVTILNVLACVFTLMKSKGINLILYDMAKREHKEFALTEMELLSTLLAREK